jgi:valyl-tRNA synthetase
LTVALMLDKAYTPKDVEPRQYARWEASGAFQVQPGSGARPYTIMMPPPNVTGSLHMGHALDVTLQDILIRYQRMRGRDALWQPGMDHAGIATQMVVERQLAEQQLRRADLGRAKFIEKVWAWKAESGGTILRQQRRLGASADWSRERFTMDEGLSSAVRTVFVELYRQGLIYKDKRLVNWDPKLETAISDLEVQQEEVKGQLWYFNYPVEGEAGVFVTVATTRPETMLGDTGVAVHPEDGRYKHLVGKHCVLPLVGRRIPILADDFADPEQGSGAVKLTPAHDFGDFEVGRRHGLEIISVLDSRARINEAAPAAYRGLDRFEARKRVVADLEALGLVAKVEPHTHIVPHGDRGGVPIEPFLTDQWYVDAATLAKPAIAAVETGRTRFVPALWTKTYYEWMHNIQPWCISRQLWWGHQIPAWYGPDGKIFVAMSEAEAAAEARLHYGRDVALNQDPDVLDTWFSSALWPFSTLGWPDPAPEVKRYYPGDVLVTGFDIIFFWVARMMMMGLHFMGDVPFRTVYIHALIRDAQGQKMSKSKGNIIDPLELIDRYGCDALRFTLAILETQGRDIKLAESRVEGSRNFMTKLWNAARFAEMNQCQQVPGFDPAACRLTLNRWIVGKTRELGETVTAALDAYRFNEMADALYHFTWGTLCDWYLELVKPLFLEGGEAAEEARATLAWVLDQVLLLMHPVCPFITEEQWEKTAPERASMLISAPWPSYEAIAIDSQAAAEIDWLIRLIGQIRAVRAEMNVPAAARIEAFLQGANAVTLERLERHRDAIQRLARLARVGPLDSQPPSGAVQLVLDEAIIMLPLANVVDLAAERARLERERHRVQGEMDKIAKKLANRSFVERAPPDIVDEQRGRHEEFMAAHAKLSEAIGRLAAL